MLRMTDCRVRGPGLQGLLLRCLESIGRGLPPALGVRPAERLPCSATRRRRSHVVSAVIAAVALGGSAFCVSSFGQGVGDIGAVNDPNAIVDCRLPRVMRNLGSGAMYTLPGRVIKIAVKECEVRGGEYVLFDRADPATALKIWQSAAEQGDAVAQFRVGQIYEMGISATPDYAAAALWYRKAADQGNRPAQINLAVLYEKGLGVKQDPVAALNLYRKAQGLSSDLVSDKQVSALQENLKKAQDRLNQLEAEIRQLRQAGAPTSQKEQELREAHAQVDGILGGKQVPLGLVVDVGERAGSKPSIQLIDPSLVLTRGNANVSIRGGITSQPVVGRVRFRDSLASFTVNDRDVPLDRFGFFETSVSLGSDRTPVHIVAIDRSGERDELSMSLTHGAASVESRPRVILAASAFGTYHALVIGNNLYRSWPALKTPVDDAKAVAELLRSKYGFKAQVLLNATFEQTLNAMNDLVKTLGPNDNLLIYYAGHGQFDLGKRGYWIPVDAETDRNTRWILNVQITDLLLKMSARKIIVVSDSCYSGALTAAENGAIPTILNGISDETRAEVAKQFSDVVSRTILTSGALQPVWDVGFGGHSLFAKAFLDVLTANDSVLEGYRLFESIETRVVRGSRKIREQEEKLGRTPSIEGDQTPFYAAIQHAGHQGADFVFVPSSR